MQADGMPPGSGGTEEHTRLHLDFQLQDSRIVREISHPASCLFYGYSVLRAPREPQTGREKYAPPAAGLRKFPQPLGQGTRRQIS